MDGDDDFPSEGWENLSNVKLRNWKDDYRQSTNLFERLGIPFLTEVKWPGENPEFCPVEGQSNFTLQDLDVLAGIDHYGKANGMMYGIASHLHFSGSNVSGHRLEVSTMRIARGKTRAKTDYDKALEKLRKNFTPTHPAFNVDLVLENENTAVAYAVIVPWEDYVRYLASFQIQGHNFHPSFFFKRDEPKIDIYRNPVDKTAYVNVLASRLRKKLPPGSVKVLRR